MTKRIHMIYREQYKTLIIRPDIKTAVLHKLVSKYFCKIIITRRINTAVQHGSDIVFWNYKSNTPVIYAAV